MRKHIAKLTPLIHDRLSTAACFAASLMMKRCQTSGSLWRRDSRWEVIGSAK